MEVQLALLAVPSSASVFECLDSSTNAAKHISNSNEVKAHTCYHYCVHLSRKYHTHTHSHAQLCRELVVKCNIQWTFELGSFRPGNIFRNLFHSASNFRTKLQTFAIASLAHDETIYLLMLYHPHTYSLNSSLFFFFFLLFFALCRELSVR